MYNIPARTIGRFSIPLEMVEGNAPLVRKIMGTCVIVRCEYMYGKNSFDYVAISPEFDVVEEGQMIPEYAVWVNADDSISFKKGRPA